MPFGPLAGAAVAGGASLLGSAISSAFNAWQAGKNRAFQERMSSTSHQREVADLRAAGLNPILSARLGGASSPSGSSAQAASSNLGHDTMAGMQMKAQLELLRAQTEDTNSAASLKRTQAGDITYGQQERVMLMLAQARQALASGDLNEHQVRKMRSEVQVLEAQLRQIQLQSTHSAYDLDRARAERDFYRTPLGKAVPFGKVYDLIPSPRLRIKGR